MPRITTSRSQVTSIASEFIDRLASEFTRLHLTDTSLLLAVSGGADSTSLLRASVELKNRLHIQPIVAHLHHGIRGTDADADLEWVRQLCQSFDVECHTQIVDVPMESRDSKRGIEETARKLRYEFLSDVAEKNGIPFVLTAHTADDQAETVLHHILRGTGIGGLRGISDATVLSPRLTLVRPLLAFRRAEILAYLNELRQDYRTDDSNTDLDMTRNRLRNVLLPLLEQEFNPQVKSALCRLGTQAGEVHETLKWLVEQMFQPTVESFGERSARIETVKCAEIPPMIIREGLIRLWDQQNWPRRQMGSDEWRLLERMIMEPDLAPLTLPGGIRAARHGTQVVLTRG